MGEAVCCNGLCHKCWAAKWIVLGVLVLAWNWYLTGYFYAKDWPTFIGVLAIVKGVLKLAKPTCPHCEAKPATKKR